MFASCVYTDNATFASISFKDCENIPLNFQYNTFLSIYVKSVEMPCLVPFSFDTWFVSFKLYFGDFASIVVSPPLIFVACFPKPHKAPAFVLHFPVLFPKSPPYLYTILSVMKRLCSFLHWTLKVMYDVVQNMVEILVFTLPIYFPSSVHCYISYNRISNQFYFMIFVTLLYKSTLQIHPAGWDVFPQTLEENEML